MRPSLLPIPRLLWALLGLVSLHALMSTAALTFERAVGGVRYGPLAIGLSFVAVALALIRRHHCALTLGLRKLTTSTGTLGSRRWLLACLLGGILIRLLFLSLAHVEPQSDSAVYLALATRLSQGLSYETEFGYAYWPPGYPLFLVIPFVVFGASTLLPLLLNVVLFVASILAVHRLAMLIAGRSAARLSTLVLTVWPNYAISSMLASKELLLAVLLPIALLLYLDNSKEFTPRRTLHSLAAGVLLGYASLTQPSCLLLLGALALTETLLRRPAIQTSLRLVSAVIGMTIVLGPWTLRNYRVFHAVVLVSTNGGSNFYRANNAQASGGYVAEVEQTSQGASELERGRVGMHMGIAWIRQNPGEFMRLVVRKQVLLLGDDGAGMYEVMKRGKQPGLWYRLLRGVGNMYWFGVWILTLLAVWHQWRSPLAINHRVAILIVTILYFIAVHSVFESGSKYHDPLVGVLAVLAGLSAADGRGFASALNQEPGRDRREV